MTDEILTAAALARVGRTLRGKWRLDRLIGVGGMASVYAATHRNGKRGAVKLLHAALSTNDDARERFLREGYTANKVDHPGVVSVLDDDYDDKDGTVFIVMELLEGRPVDKIAEAHGNRLPPGQVIAIADPLLNVLVAAHAQGIVHRDLKPENLFLTNDGQLKVLDFGIARLREAASSSSATRTGSMMGTPAYMPPEQALGNTKDIDSRTDIWAAGATMFNLLTGETVHQADTLNKVLLAAMTQPARPVMRVAPHVPQALAMVVDRALAFDRDHRWQDARQMLEALRAAAPHASPVGMPTFIGHQNPDRRAGEAPRVAATTPHNPAHPSYQAGAPANPSYPHAMGSPTPTGPVPAQFPMPAGATISAPEFAPVQSAHGSHPSQPTAAFQPANPNTSNAYQGSGTLVGSVTPSVAAPMPGATKRSPMVPIFAGLAIAGVLGGVAIFMVTRSGSSASSAKPVAAETSQADSTPAQTATATATTSAASSPSAAAVASAEPASSSAASASAAPADTTAAPAVKPPPVVKPPPPYTPSYKPPPPKGRDHGI